MEDMWALSYYGIERIEIAEALEKKGSIFPIAGPEAPIGVSIIASKAVISVIRGWEEA